jgi:hypothetical protein
MNKINVGHGKFSKVLNGIGFVNQLLKHGAVASQRLLNFRLGSRHHAEFFFA